MKIIIHIFLIILIPLIGGLSFYYITSKIEDKREYNKKIKFVENYLGIKLPYYPDGFTKKETEKYIGVTGQVSYISVYYHRRMQQLDNRFRDEKGGFDENASCIEETTKTYRYLITN